MRSLYCVFDKAAKTFADPFVSVNDKTAIRYFTQIISTSLPQSSYSDFELYFVGNFDEDTASFKDTNLPDKIFGGDKIEV